MKKYVFKGFKNDYAFYKHGIKKYKKPKYLFPSYINEGEVFIIDEDDNIILLKDESILRYKKVKNFDLRKNTFQFKNISTESSPLGNCFGISYVEKELFLNRM